MHVDTSWSEFVPKFKSILLYQLLSFKEIPRCCKTFKFLIFEWLPFFLFSLKVPVKGPKCEWRRLLLVQNLPTFFHPAEKLTEQNWQRRWVCPDISVTVFTVESGFWQRLNKGTSPAEPRPAIHLPDLAFHELVLSLFASQFQPGISFILVGGLFSFVSSISFAIETFY